MFRGEENASFLTLLAWFSYASIVRIKGNNKDKRLISIILKVSPER